MSVEEYARMLSLNYRAGQPAALQRMAEHALKQRDDDLYELKMDRSVRGALSVTRIHPDRFVAYSRAG